MKESCRMNLDGYFVLILIVVLLRFVWQYQCYLRIWHAKKDIMRYFVVFFLGIFGILYIAIFPCKQNINNNIE